MPNSSPKIIRDLLLILLLSLASGLVWNRTLLVDVWQGRAVTGKAPAAPVAEVQEPLPLGLAQVKEFFDRRDALLVDARDAADYRKGHIAGAVSLPLGTVEERLSAFLRRAPLTATLVVYCNGFDCHDSGKLGQRLLAAGYREVYVYLGGFPEWQAAGYPVTEGERE
jgi:rhodanese-related sulfurtransferase